MAPKLEKYFTLRAYISKNDTTDMKVTRNGNTRNFIPVTHGYLEGSGLKAELLPGGGDAIMIDTVANVAYLDVRTHARTDESEAIYIHYNGVMHLDAAIQKVISWSGDAKTTNLGDHEFFASPQLETSDPEFKWIESASWVGQGHWLVEEGERAVEYAIYRVVN